jgi:hypothetical protein
VAVSGRYAQAPAPSGISPDSVAPPSSAYTNVSNPGPTGRVVPPPAGSAIRYSPIRDGASRGVTSFTTGASPNSGSRPA